MNDWPLDQFLRGLGPKLLLSFGEADSDGRQAVRRRTGASGSFSFATCQRDRLNSCRLSAASGDTMKKPDAVSADCDLDRRTVLKFAAGVSAFAIASRGPVSAAV